MHLGLTGARNSEAPESHHNYVLHMRTLKPYNAQTARLDNSLRLLLRHVFCLGCHSSSTVWEPSVSREKKTCQLPPPLLQKPGS